MNAATNRERSWTFENIEPAGQLAVLSAAGRITYGGFDADASWPCARGYVIAIVGRNVERDMPSGVNTRCCITSAYGLPAISSAAKPAIQYPGLAYEWIAPGSVKNADAFIARTSAPSASSSCRPNICAPSRRPAVCESS